MKVLQVIVCLYLILHGTYAIYSFFKKKESVFAGISSTDYFFKKLLGNNHKYFANLFWGLIELILGVGFILTFLFN